MLNIEEYTASLSHPVPFMLFYSVTIVNIIWKELSKRINEDYSTLL